MTDRFWSLGEFAEDTSWGLVWVQPPAVNGVLPPQVLTLPITKVNEGHRALLMYLDLGVGPQPGDLLTVTSGYQLTCDVSYAVSLTDEFILTRTPTLDDWPDRKELNEGKGSNTSRTPEHHAARDRAHQFTVPPGEDWSAYRYLGLLVAASSTGASDPPITGQYLTVNRDYGNFTCKQEPLDLDAYIDARIAAYIAAHPA